MSPKTSSPILSPLDSRYTDTDLPDFGGMKVLITQGAFMGSVIELFAKCNFTMAHDIKEADLVCFTGGGDVDPKLYGEQNVSSSFSFARDEREKAIYHEALEWDVPMYGICRGFQFLHVMNGGTLWQHIDNHGRSHDIVDTETAQIIKASSVHHQMLRDNPKLTILALTNNQVATSFKSATAQVIKGIGSTLEEPLEIEAGCWVETKCFGVQGHPELFDSHPEFASWSMNKLNDFLYELDVMANEEGFHNNPPNFLSASVH